MTAVIQAYRFALDPTPRQRRVLASHCGAARYAYNWGLRLVQQRMEQGRAGEDVEVPWTLSKLRREWNQTKTQIAPWWAENSKEAYSSGLDGLARALKNWTDHRSGRRRGRRMGFPRPKRKGHCRDACRFTTARSRCSPTAGISSFRGSASSRPTSPQGSWPVALNRVLPESSPPPSAARLTAGSSPSPSRCNGISQPATARRAWSEWTSVSATWPCCPLVWWFPIPMRSNGLCARCGGSTGNFIAASWALAVAARPDGGSRGSMPEPGWSEIATWPVPWPMPAWPDCAASSATRPTGMVAGSSSPTPSIPRPRRARPVAG